LFITALIYSGCRPETDDKSLTVFKYNESAGISSLDPAFARNQANIWVVNQLFNGLVQLDSNLKVIPCIAKNWHISDDGNVYTFIIRDDVYFHDSPSFQGGKGRKVTASDFEFSFKRLVYSRLASPGSWIFNNVKQLKGDYLINAINDTILRIELMKPFPPFIGMLSMQYCSVVPKEAVEFYGPDFRVNPVGTGPFKFKMLKEGVKLVLVRNDMYFERDSSGQRLPYLNGVSVSFIIDKQSAFLEFVKGNLDFMSGLDASYKDELLTPAGKLKEKYRARINLISQPYLNTEYLGIINDPGNQFIKTVL